MTDGRSSGAGLGNTRPSDRGPKPSHVPPLYLHPVCFLWVTNESTSFYSCLQMKWPQDITQLVACLLGMHKALAWAPAPHVLGKVAHESNLLGRMRTWRTSWLHSKCGASLGYLIEYMRGKEGNRRETLFYCLSLNTVQSHSSSPVPGLMTLEAALCATESCSQMSEKHMACEPRGRSCSSGPSHR